MHKFAAVSNKIESDVYMNYLGLQCYQVDLKGRFAPGWVGHLSNGLAHRNINITRVEAARGVGMQWSARLNLDFTTTDIRPDDLDYIGLSRESSSAVKAESLCIESLKMEFSTDCDGSLYLEAGGPDRIGILSSLLNRFSLFSLFPVKMLVETKNNRIFDRFWLKGLGSSIPSKEAVSALKERLEEEN